MRVVFRVFLTLTVLFGFKSSIATSEPKGSLNLHNSHNTSTKVKRFKKISAQDLVENSSGGNSTEEFTIDDFWDLIGNGNKQSEIISGLVNPLTSEPNVSINIPNYVGSDFGVKFPIRINYTDHRNGLFDAGKSFRAMGEGWLGDYYDPLGIGWQVGIPILRRLDSYSDEWQLHIPGRILSKVLAPRVDQLDPGETIQFGVWYDTTEELSCTPPNCGQYEIALEEEVNGLSKIEYSFDGIKPTPKFRFTFPDGVSYTFKSPTGLASTNVWVLESIIDRTGNLVINTVYPDTESPYEFRVWDNYGNDLWLISYNDTVSITVWRNYNIVAKYEGQLQEFDLLWHNGTETEPYDLLIDFYRVSPNDPSKRERIYDFEYYTTQDGSWDTGVLTAFTNAHGGRVEYNYTDPFSPFFYTELVDKFYFPVVSVELNDGLGNLSTYNYLNSHLNAITISNPFIDDTETNQLGVKKIRHAIISFKEQNPDTSWLIIEHDTANIWHVLRDKVKSISWALDNSGIPDASVKKLEFNWDLSWRLNRLPSTQAWIPVVTSVDSNERGLDGGSTVIRTTDYEYNDRGQILYIKQHNDDATTLDDRTTETIYLWESSQSALDQHFLKAKTQVTNYSGLNNTGEILYKKKITWENSTGTLQPDTAQSWIGDINGDSVEDYLTTDLTFSQLGQLLSETSPSSVLTSYAYNGPNLKDPTTVTVQGSGGTTYSESFTYTPEGFLNTATNRRGSTSTFGYDDFWRTVDTTLVNEANTYTTQTEYYFTDFPTWKKDTFYNLPNHPNDETIIYYDGFGRQIQLRKYDSNLNKDLVSTTFYDIQGKIYRSYYPVIKSHKLLYDPSDINADQYVEALYTSDGLSRLRSYSTPDMNDDDQREVVSVEYYTDYIVEKLTDPNPLNPLNGFFRRKDFDALGQLTSVTEDYQGIDEAVTSYEYSKRDELVQITDPDGRITKFNHTPEGIHYVNFPDLTGKVRDHSGDWHNYNFINSNLTDSSGKTWDQKIISDSFLRPIITFLPNTSLVTQTAIVKTYDDLDRLTRTLSVSTETDQFISENKNHERDIDIKNWYDDYVYESPNVDNITAGTPPATDALGRNLFSEGSASANGLVTKKWSPGSTTLFYYDSRGRIYAKDHYIDANENSNYESVELFRFKYAYDNLGRVIALQYPNNHVLKINYDGFGRVTSQDYDDGFTETTLANLSYLDILDNRPLLQSIELDPDSVTGPDSLLLSYEHNPAGKLTYIFADLSPTYFERLLNHDLRGNVVSILDQSSTLADFSYDRLSRVSDITSNGTTYGEDKSYNYDSFGNRQSEITPSEILQYTYHNFNNEITNLIKRDGTYHYYTDERGRRIARTALGESSYYHPQGYAMDTYFYDDLNRLIAYGYYTPPRGATPNLELKSRYVYGPEGKRILKFSNSENILYLYNGEEVIYSKNLNTNEGTNYIFSGNQRAAKHNDSGFYYYIKDHLGSTQLMVHNDTVEPQPLRDVYGNYLSGNLPGERFSFTDREQDQESGLIYMNARYYDPKIGRFITPDPLLGNITSPRSTNRFTYVLNNPVRFVDQTGLYGEDYDYDGGYNVLDPGYDFDGWDSSRVYDFPARTVSADSLEFNRSMDWRFEDEYDSAMERDLFRERKNDHDTRSLKAAGIATIALELSELRSKVFSSTLGKLTGLVGLTVWVGSFLEGAMNSQLALAELEATLSKETWLIPKIGAVLDHFLLSFDGARTLGAIEYEGRLDYYEQMRHMPEEAFPPYNSLVPR